ncbi:hypothetical protein R1flu_023776 [Riccia fluitans]|uniref:Glycerol-3-phosphate dehydrogenase NAD-dependent N-terminal domain-containing protein n=1 Tax=Riccia fluitans TaxID=41844 RepID=A0ABD1XT31_9MARC
MAAQKRTPTHKEVIGRTTTSLLPRTGWKAIGPEPFIWGSTALVTIEFGHFLKSSLFPRDGRQPFGRAWWRALSLDIQLYAVDVLEMAPPDLNSAGGGTNCGREMELDRIAVIGSGNWGSVAARLAATNARRLPCFQDEVRVWVYEERMSTGELLSDVINKTQENVKYLPNVKLGPNVVADPNLESAVKNATMLVFVMPHQFIDGTCEMLKGKIRPDAKAISLIKGMELRDEGPRLISKEISDQLGIDCSVLMGANIANEIAVEQFSEATIGYRYDKETADKWVKVFGTPYFEVTPIQDVEGVELR